jgi:hypothetical protein
MLPPRRRVLVARVLPPKAAAARNPPARSLRKRLRPINQEGIDLVRHELPVWNHVKTVQTDEEGHPQRVQLRRVSGFTRAEVHRYAQLAITPGSQVVSDGLGCFRAFESPVYTHERIITGTYHAIRGHHVPRYLAEFEYRFNRRYDLKAMIPRFLTVATRTPPMPYRLLRLAEPYA